MTLTMFANYCPELLHQLRMLQAASMLSCSMISFNAVLCTSLNLIELERLQLQSWLQAKPAQRNKHLLELIHHYVQQKRVQTLVGNTSVDVSLHEYVLLEYCRQVDVPPTVRGKR